MAAVSVHRRKYRERHESFADQASIPVRHVAIHHARRFALPQDARIGLDFPMLDAFEEVNLQLDREDARAPGRSQKCRESPRRIGQTS